MSDAVIQARIRAFDEFTQQFQRFQQELQRIEQSENRVTASTEQVNRSMDNLHHHAGRASEALRESGQQHQRHAGHAQDNHMAILGLIGAFYTYQRTLRDTVRTGMEFEASMSRVAALSGAVGKDFDLLRQKAIELGTGTTIFSASQAAEGMSFLAMAGFEVNETLEAMPGLLAAAAAGGMDLGRTADIVSNILTGFNIKASETGRVADVLTATFTSSNTTLDMLGQTMSYVAPVAAGIGMSLEDVAAAAGKLGDAGIQGGRAGTALRQMLLRLVNPTQEVAQTLEQLEIKITDTNGKLLDLPDIIGEAKGAMEGYNEASRAQIAAVLAGTEAASAFMALIEAGPDKLRAYAEELANSEGEAQRIADTMQNNLKGAITELNSTIDAAKISITQGLEPAVLSVVGVIQMLVTGFNSLDEEGQKLISMLMGAAGLATAFGAVALSAKMMGITMAMVLHPITLTIAAVTALAGAVLIYKGHQERLDQQRRESIQANLNQADSIERLLNKYEELSGKTDRTESEQRDLERVIRDLTDVVPEAISGFDSMGNAILNVGTASEEARKKMAALRDEAVKNAEINAEIARARLPELLAKREKAAAERDSYLELLKSGSALTQAKWESVQGQRVTNSADLNKVYAARLEEAKRKYDEINKMVLDAERDIAMLRGIQASQFATGEWNEPVAGKKAPEATSSGGKTFVPPKMQEKSSTKNELAEAAKAYIDTINNALMPYRDALAATTNTVAGLAAKEQHLSQVMQSGQATAWQAIELNKARTDQLAMLSDLQGDLHQQAEAERQALADLQEQYAKATDPEAAAILKDEIDSLARSISQAGQAWWQAERQKFSLLQQIEREEKQYYDNAFQQAMSLMRHQVNMARMSTDEQITYLEKLREAHSWSIGQMQDIEENLYRLRRQQLGEYLSGLESEYRAKLDAIDERTKQTISGLQAQIDALNSQDKASTREEAARKHNVKLAELEERRQYHQRRTGRQHEQALFDIEKQITEEKQRWELQQQQWERDDQKEHLQKQIEQARDAGAEERTQLEQHYREARRIAESGILDIIASMAATSPAWFDAGKMLIDQLIAGLGTGNFAGIQAQIDSLRDQARQAQELANQVISVPSVNQSAPWVAQYNANKDIWDRDASLSGVNPGDRNTWTAAMLEANRQNEEIRRKYGFTDTGKLPMYKHGGPVDRTGLALVHEGEYMLPANLVDAIRRGAPPPSTVSSGDNSASAIERAADRIVAAINEKMGINLDKLLNIENFNNEDSTDVEILSRELARTITAIG